MTTNTYLCAEVQGDEYLFTALYVSSKVMKNMNAQHLSRKNRHG